MHRDNEAVNCIQQYWTGTYQVLPLHWTETFYLACPNIQCAKQSGVFTSPAAAVHRIWPSNSHFSLSCLYMTIRAGRIWRVISRPLSHVVCVSLCVHLRTEEDIEYRYGVDVVSCIVTLLHIMPHYADTTALAKISAVCYKAHTHTHSCTYVLESFPHSVIIILH